MTSNGEDAASSSGYRHDPISGHWTIIAPERADRPLADSGDDELPCPFCAGAEELTPPEVWRDNDPESGNWRVRAFPNKYPAVRLDSLAGGIGVHEVVVERPDHKTTWQGLSDDHVAAILRCWRDRLRLIAAGGRCVHASVFRNQGVSAGASQFHSHSQILATTFIPPRFESEFSRSIQAQISGATCPCCAELCKERLAVLRGISDDETFVALAPFASRFPFEVRIIPNEHNSNFELCDDATLIACARTLRLTMGALEQVVAGISFNLILHSGPLRQPYIGQYHWHFEIAPRVFGLAGFEIGGGAYLNPIPPEIAAMLLRDQLSA